MQHLDRRLLIAGISHIVDEIYGLPAAADVGERLRDRLNPLLDAFLLEFQPVTGTEVTVLLADLRGFTALMRALPPRTMADLLNRWFGAMCEVIHRHGGVIDKFMGDSVMALFGAPQRRPDDLARALACAVEMQQAMVSLNADNAARGEPSLYAGIAINTGEVMAGSFGPPGHNEYTVIGDTVNLVSRIEGFALRGQVLLSAETHAAAGDFIEVGSVNEVWVKGMPGPVPLYELVSVTRPRRLVIPRVEVRRSPRIAVDLSAMFRRVESKRLSPEPFVGRINDLGYYGMRADLPLGLPALTEVAVRLSAHPGDEPDGDIYARVLRSWPSQGAFRTSLEVTSVDTPGHRQVKRLVDDALWRR